MSPGRLRPFTEPNVARPVAPESPGEDGLWLAAEEAGKPFRLRHGAPSWRTAEDDEFRASTERG